MSGEVRGVAFTVIGTLGQSETWGGETWAWVDHMIYSPTHGYAWITVEDGHVLLTRKVRDFDGTFLTSAAVERSEQRPGRHWRGRSYQYYATSNWRTDYVEGAFNFRPAVGDRGTTVSMMPGGRAVDMLHFVEGAHGAGEREVEVSRYAPELAAAFGAEAPRPQGTHPLQPYVPRAGTGFLAAWFGGLVAAALLGAIVVLGARGAERLLWEGVADAGGVMVPFELTATDRPARLRIETEVDQSWTWLGVEVEGPDGPVFGTGREVGYYSGGSGEDRWSEGSRRTAIGFVPGAAGPHVLRLAVEEGDRASERVRVFLRERQTNATWLLGAALLFGLAAAWFASAALRHRKRRWAGGDWTDEDDD
nr:DUF4178 domain-containing protein [Jannaschia sp. Os4]